MTFTVKHSSSRVHLTVNTVQEDAFVYFVRLYLMNKYNINVMKSYYGSRSWLLDFLQCINVFNLVFW